MNHKKNMLRKSILLSLMVGTTLSVMPFTAHAMDDAKWKSMDDAAKYDYIIKNSPNIYDLTDEQKNWYLKYLMSHSINQPGTTNDYKRDVVIGQGSKAWEANGSDYSGGQSRVAIGTNSNAMHQGVAIGAQNDAFGVSDIVLGYQSRESMVTKVLLTVLRLLSCLWWVLIISRYEMAIITVAC